MAFVSVYDESSETEITLFPEAYLKSMKALKKNHIVVISGYMKKNRELSVDSLVDIKEFENE